MTYDQASNIVGKNSNTYSYDAVNQLVGASESGWFQQKPSDIAPEYTTAPRDYQGTAVLSFASPVTTTIGLDTASQSVGIDLGPKAPYGVNRIELHPQTPSPRVGLHDDLSVYISSDNATYTKLSGWQLALNSDGSIALNFPKIFTARYIKINTIWDDRDISDASIDESTFKNTPSELVKVWTLVTSRSEAYGYDAMGNRSSVTTDGVAQGYTYYPNAQGGNLSWVRYDGSWYYEYDQDGNRILKAKALLPGSYGSESPDPSQEYWKYTWDLHNRLIAVEKNGHELVSYTYDAENFRVERVGPEGTTVYAYDRDAALAYEKNLSSGASRTIVHLGGQIVGWTDTTGGTSSRYYALTDQLGSVTQVLDANATVVWQSEYTPFGRVAGAQGNLSFSGMFAGEDIDPDTYLTYQWNRWRSEDGSSWISEDPAQNGTRRFNPLRSPETVLTASQVGGAGALALGPQDYNGVSFGGYDSGIGGAYNYNRLNWYEYCDNNPLRFLDPSGLIAQLDDSPGHNVTYNPHTGETKVNGHVTERDHPGSSRTSQSVLPVKGTFQKIEQGVTNAFSLDYGSEEFLQAGIDFQEGSIEPNWRMLEKYGKGILNAVSGGMKFGIDTTLSPAIKVVDSVKDAYALLGAKVTTDPVLNLGANTALQIAKATLPEGGAVVTMPSLPGNSITETQKRVFDFSDALGGLLDFLHH